MLTNPNGANQYVKDPRQKLCWDLYVNPDSDTFSNGLQSALKAGYDEEYAAHITLQAWFCENLRRFNIVNKAEKNLEGLLESSDEKIKADMTKFTLETLGKKHYSKRSEITGADGQGLIPSKEQVEEANKVINQFLDGNNGNIS